MGASVDMISSPPRHGYSDSFHESLSAVTMCEQ